MSTLPECRYTYHALAWYLRRTEEGVKSPGTGVAKGWKLPCRYWKWTLGPLKEHQAFITSATELSLQPTYSVF